MTSYADKPWVAQYPTHVPPTLDARFGDMLAVWEATVARLPDQPCLHYFDTTLTFREVDRAADALAAALHDRGHRAGARVAIYVQNDPVWPIGLIACWKAGAIAVALNPMFKHKELSYHLNDSGASVLLCLDGLYLKVAREVVPETDVVQVITCRPHMWLADGPVPATVDDHGPLPSDEGVENLAEILERFAGREAPAPDLGPDDVAILTYTSGTTGPPKGAMNTHGNMAYNSQLTTEWFSLDDHDTILGVAPLFHITGIVAHMGVSWYSGSPLVLFHRFDVEEAMRLIERWRASFTIGAITVYIAIMDHPRVREFNLSTLVKVASGGAPVSPAIVDRFRQVTGVQVLNVYGLTETTSPSHLTPLGADPPVDEASGALSVGVPVPGVEVQIVDVGTGDEVPIGASGEIVIAGPMVIPGYWEKPEESAYAVPDGHLHTGDVGFMDEQGWFFIVDRKKDQINAGGYKIWPREVEDVLYQNPSVREAAVVGVPDEYRGETVKAFVSLVSGASATPEELIEFCRDRLAAYKYPRQLDVLDELPKTPTGKFLRRKLRDDEVRKARSKI